jgi:hypothetical protein
MATTIDLTFASQGVSQTLEFCGTQDEQALLMDHIPIRITLDTNTPPQVSRKRFAHKKLDTPKFRCYIRDSGWADAPCPLTTLQTAICTGLELYCPRARPSPHASHIWSPRASELLKGARRARRSFLVTESPLYLQQYKALTNSLKREIRRVSRDNWRRFVQESTEDPETAFDKGLWRLSR